MGYSTYQGKVRIKNESKYIGDPNNIVYRSSWEAMFSKYLDLNENVIRWGSEEIMIPYFNEADGKNHRYFPDYYVEFKNGKKIVVEIKPYGQTQPPVLKPRGNAKRYAEARDTYIKNCCKWTAAKEWCEERGMSFIVFTENELNKLRINKQKV